MVARLLVFNDCVIVTVSPVVSVPFGLLNVGVLPKVIPVAFNTDNACAGLKIAADLPTPDETKVVGRARAKCVGRGQIGRIDQMRAWIDARW